MTAGDLGRTAQAEDQAHRAEPETEMGSRAKRARLGEDICMWRNALDGVAKTLSGL